MGFLWAVKTYSKCIVLFAGDDSDKLALPCSFITSFRQGKAAGEPGFGARHRRCLPDLRGACRAPSGPHSAHGPTLNDTADHRF